MQGQMDISHGRGQNDLVQLTALPTTTTTTSLHLETSSFLVVFPCYVGVFTNISQPSPSKLVRTEMVNSTERTKNSSKTATFGLQVQYHTDRDQEHQE